MSVHVWHGLAGQPWSKTSLLVVDEELAGELGAIRNLVRAAVSADLARRPALLRWFKRSYNPDGTPNMAGFNAKPEDIDDDELSIKPQPFAVAFDVFHAPTIENASVTGGDRTQKSVLLYSSTTALSGLALTLDLLPESVMVMIPGGKVVKAARTVQRRGGLPVYQALVSRQDAASFY